MTNQISCLEMFCLSSCLWRPVPLSPGSGLSSVNDKHDGCKSKGRVAPLCLINALWGLFNYFWMQFIYSDMIFHWRHGTWKIDVHISLITKNKPNACSRCIVLLSAPRGSYRNSGKFIWGATLKKKSSSSSFLFCLTSSDHFNIKAALWCYFTN